MSNSIGQIADYRFIENEDLIAKYKLLELLQEHHSYSNVPPGYQTSFFNRVLIALEEIPSEYKKYALALFANVFYINAQVLKDSLKHLYAEICHFSSDSSYYNDFHFFEVDPSGITQDFFRINGIKNRLDLDSYSRIASVGTLFETLEAILDSNDKRLHQSIEESLVTLFNKKKWVVLTDFALSGTSVVSEVTKLITFLEKCFDNEKKPEILICIQILTHDAKIALDNLLNEHSNLHLFYSLFFGEEVKINSDKCQLFNSKETLKGVQDLCEWYYECFIVKDEQHKNTIEKSGTSMIYGFKNCGYTIIPQKNAPSNSIPLLWNAPSQNFIEENNIEYKPPFPRTISRRTQKSGGDRQRLENLLLQKDKINSFLNSILNK